MNDPNENTLMTLLNSIVKTNEAQQDSIKGLLSCVSMLKERVEVLESKMSEVI